jgi:hypothetical protein
MDPVRLAKTEFLPTLQARKCMAVSVPGCPGYGLPQPVRALLRVLRQECDYPFDVQLNACASGVSTCLPALMQGTGLTFRRVPPLFEHFGHFDNT